MTDGERLVELAAIWTVLAAGAVATLAVVARTGPAGSFSGAHAALHASGPAVRGASLLAWGFLLLLPVLVLGAPLVVSWYRVSTGTYDFATGVAGTVAALAAFPGVPVVWGAHGLVGGLVLAGVAVGAFLVGVDRIDRDPTRHVVPSLSSQFAHVALFVLLLAGVVAGSAVGVGMQSLAETDSVVPPKVAFDASYSQASDGQEIVTIRHVGGESVDASVLSLYGDGFAAVPEADQTGPGNWQGTTGDPPGHVDRGDEVTVGVEGDCRIRVVYEGVGYTSVMAVFECEELR